jgi:hypothetical protein
VFPIPIELIRPLLAAPVPLKSAAPGRPAANGGDDATALAAPPIR